jgi:uncharacterized protein
MYWQAFLGGLYIATAVGYFTLLTGRVFGINGVLNRLVSSPLSVWEKLWHAGLLSGLAIGAHLAKGYVPLETPANVLFPTFSPLLIAFGGLCVSLGTRIGSGCTSGHAVCGISRLSRRSVVATALSMTSACLVSNLFGVYPYFISPPPALRVAIVDLVTPAWVLASSTVVFGVLLIISPLLKRYSKVMMVPISTGCGLLFGAGLEISGMVDPNNLRAFFSAPMMLVKDYVYFDPSMVIVMASAVLPNMFLYNVIIKHMKSPLLAKEFQLPGSKVIDRKLVIGQVIFGVGWGISCFCVGPAISSLLTVLDGNTDLIYFLTGFIFGMYPIENVLM